MSSKQKLLQAVDEFRNELMYGREKVFNSLTYDNVQRSLFNARQRGTTTSLVGVLKINPDAVLVVGNSMMAEDVSKTHRVDRHRVLSAQNFKENAGFLFGGTGPVLFDTSAILAILANIREEVTNG